MSKASGIAALLTLTLFAFGAFSMLRACHEDEARNAANDEKFKAQRTAESAVEEYYRLGFVMAANGSRWGVSRIAEHGFSSHDAVVTVVLDIPDRYADEIQRSPTSAREVAFSNACPNAKLPLSLPPGFTVELHPESSIPHTIFSDVQCLTL